MDVNFCSCGVKSEDDYTFDQHIQLNADVAHVICSEREYILYEHIRELQQLVIELDNKLAILQSTVSFNVNNISNANYK
jgi:predicted DNA-binding helix-hairpin-helix protein